MFRNERDREARLRILRRFMRGLGTFMRGAFATIIEFNVFALKCSTTMIGFAGSGLVYSAKVIGDKVYKQMIDESDLDQYKKALQTIDVTDNYSD